MKNLTIPSSLSSEETEDYSPEYGAAIQRFFSSFESSKPIILLTAFFCFIYFPIVALLPFLLYLQVHISALAQRKKNQEVTAIKNTKIDWVVVFTITICIFILATYNSAIFVYSDTQNYLNFFNDIEFLDFNGSLDYLASIRQEPVTMMSMKTILWMLGLSDNSFLLVGSLVINTGLLLLTRYFIPRFFPLVTLVNVMSNRYYFQLFYFRHTFSFLFVLPLLFTDNILVVTILFIITFYTHSTAILIFPIVIMKLLIKNISQIQKLIQSRYIKYIIFTVILVCFFGLRYFGAQLVLTALEYLKTVGVETLSRRAELQTQRIGNTGTSSSQTLMLINIVIWIFFMAKIKFESKLMTYKNNPVLYKLVLFLIINIISFLLSSFLGFNLRIAYFMFALPGLFFLIPLLSYQLEKKSLGYYLFLGQIGLTVLVFLRNLYREQQAAFYLFATLRDGQVTFWEGEPLSASIFDYIQQFMDALFF